MNQKIDKINNKITDYRLLKIGGFVWYVDKNKIRKCLVKNIVEFKNTYFISLKISEKVKFKVIEPQEFIITLNEKNEELFLNKKDANNRFNEIYKLNIQR